MTTRDIRAHLREMYDMDVSPDLISPVTYGVLEELTEWQAPRHLVRRIPGHPNPPGRIRTDPATRRF